MNATDCESPMPREPAGFCPHCDYPTDPGRCPECGLAITTQTLVTNIDRAHHRRFRRRLMWGAVCGAVAIAGYALYERVDWWSIAPTRVLLALQDGQPGPSTIELVRRLQSGALSSQEQDDFIARVIPIDQLLTFRSPYPAGVESRVSVVEEDTLFGQGGMGTARYCHMKLENWMLLLDGTRLPKPASASKRGYNERWCDERQIAPLAPGAHQLTLRGELVIRATSNGPALCTRPITVTKHLDVEDRPTSEFVRPKWSPELAAQLRERLRLSITRSHGDMYVNLQADELPVPLSGLLVVTSSARAGPEPAPSTWVTIPAHGTRHGLSSGLELAGDRFDATLTPDPAHALGDFLNDYFAGTITWKDVAAQPGKGYFTVEQTGSFPTSIVEYPAVRATSTATGPSSP